ncbi:MAG: DM13 domain-containing protein [Pseudomonadota bacterium]
MSRTIIITALVCGTLGFIAGNAFWYLASPLFFDEVVSEQAPAAGQARTLRTGQFKDADAVHKGSGTATLLRTNDGSHVVRFTDFRSTNGPDLKVYLVEAATITKSSDVTASRWISLGRLKGNVGDQNYTLPTSADPAAYKSVVIWCEQFGVLFSSAPLAPGG